MTTSQSENPEAFVTQAPRAFARGTGIVLQTVGMILTLISCCTCPMGFLSGEDSLETGEVSYMLNDMENAPSTSIGELSQDPARLGIVLLVAAATMGGLAMAGFGLGLQADKPKASYGAIISTLLHTLIQLAAGICLWTGSGPFGAIMWNLILLLLSLILNGLAIGAFIDVRKDPPPPDLDILPPDYDIPRSVYEMERRYREENPE